MRVKTLLRSGSVLWATALLVAGLLFFGSGNINSTTEYWESVTAQSTGLLGVVSAVCGASAAWETARLRQAAVATWAPSRSELRIACAQLAPVAILGLIGVLASLVAFSRPALIDVPGWPDLDVLVTAYAVVLSHIALGYLVGRRLPRLLGPALMLVVGYFWGFWPAALDEPTWLRHLNGQGIGECCRLDQVPSVRSLGATVLFSAGVVAAALVVTVTRGGKQRLLLSTAAALVGLTAGVATAAPLGYNGEQTRDRSLLQCGGSEPRVCLWPEQQAKEADFARWSQEANRRLRAVGVETARTVEFTQVVPQRDAVLAATATSQVNLDPPACTQRPAAVYPGDEAAFAIYPWLVITAGADPDSLTWPAQDIQLAEAVRELPPAAQKKWFDRNMRSVRDCSVKPDLSPSSFVPADEKKTP